MKLTDITLADVSVEAKVETLGVVLDKKLSEIDSKVSTVTKLQGPKGDKGDKGDIGPQGIAGKDGLNGKDGRDGRDGKDGIDGIDGKQGVSVNNAYVDLDGSLVVQLSDGNTIDAGLVVGPSGANGMNGLPGIAGATGATGAGVAPGGTSGQVLAKNSNTDYDTHWITLSGGGGGGITEETDPIYTASSWYSTTNNSSNWNTAYSWGNHASAGYLTSSAIGTTVQAYDADTAKYDDANAHFLGNVEVDGNVQIDGNLTVSGTTTTVTAQNLAVSDNMIYLNNAIQTTISNAIGNGTDITYTTTANHNYLAGMTVTITGVNPSGYNISGATITAVTANTFTISNSFTGTYVSGGTARAKSNANPDLGIAGGYNDGTYHHAGIFRDTTDDRWKVFHKYTPEPDDSAYIDTSHSSFELSDFQAKDIYGTLKGNADTVTNGVYTTGSYADPTWLTSISGSKVSGNISGNATNITGTYGGTLTSSQVTTALGYTPYDSTNPNGYTSNAGTVTSVSGTGTVNGITLTGTVNSSGSLTLGGTLGNIGNAQLTNSAITINGTAVSLGGSTSVGTVTSVSALTLGTTGTDLSSTVATSSTTPVITLNVPTASASNRGALSSTDWSTFNNKQAALVSGTNIKTINGTSILGSGDLTVSASAGGSNTQVQYNSGGALAGNSGFIYDGTNVGVAITPDGSSYLQIGAGTATKAPLELTASAGVLMTTPDDGSIEYDGETFFGTPIANSRGVFPTEHFVARTGTKTMTSNTSLQSIFGGGTGGLTNGALSLAGTCSYFFECLVSVSSMSATSGNFGFSLVGAGTATFTSAGFIAIGYDQTTLTTPAAASAGGTYIATTALTTNVVTATTGTAAAVLFKGIFRVNTAGTIIPSIQLTTASAAVIGVNSWFKCNPIGSNTAISVGNWS